MPTPAKRIHHCRSYPESWVRGGAAAEENAHRRPNQQTTGRLSYADGSGAKDHLLQSRDRAGRQRDGDRLENPPSALHFRSFSNESVCSISVTVTSGRRAPPVASLTINRTEELLKFSTLQARHHRIHTTELSPYQRRVERVGNEPRDIRRVGLTGTSDFAHSSLPLPARRP